MNYFDKILTNRQRTVKTFIEDALGRHTEEPFEFWWAAFMGIMCRKEVSPLVFCENAATYAEFKKHCLIPTSFLSDVNQLHGLSERHTIIFVHGRKGDSPERMLFQSIFDHAKRTRADIWHIRKYHV